VLAVVAYENPTPTRGTRVRGAACACERPADRGLEVRAGARSVWGERGDRGPGHREDERERTRGRRAR
jgi:hypothetical protein